MAPSFRREQLPAPHLLAGAEIATYLKNSLEHCAWYAQSDAAVAEALSAGDDIRTTPISPVVVGEIARDQIAQDAIAAQLDKLIRHRHTATNVHSIILPSHDGDLTWEPVKKDAAKQCTDSWAQIEDQIIRGELLPRSLYGIQPGPTELSDIVLDELRPPTEALARLVPSGDLDKADFPEGIEKDLVVTITNLFIRRKPRYMAVIDEASNHVRRISVQAKRITGYLTRLKENPDDLLAGVIAQANRDWALKDAEEAVEHVIAQQNLAIVSTLSDYLQNSSGRPAKITEPTSEKSKRRRHKRAQRNVGHVATTAAREAIISDEEGVNNLGEVIVTTPWSEMPTTTEIHECVSRGGSAYLLRAVPERLTAVVDEVREKSRTKQEDLNEFDAIAQHLCRRIAEGIMPHQNANSVKSISNHRSATYKGIPIWYSFTIAPNAPRVYFTVQKAGDVVTDPMKVDIDPEKNCIIILADADKSTQIETLGHFTGLGTRALRKGGAGSV